jgi:hypothetical protein
LPPIGDKLIGDELCPWLQPIVVIKAHRKDPAEMPIANAIPAFRLTAMEVPMIERMLGPGLNIPSAKAPKASPISGRCSTSIASMPLLAISALKVHGEDDVRSFEPDKF